MSWKKRRGDKEGGEPRVKTVLADMDLRPSKARGQNFLIDAEALDALVRFGDPKPDEKLVEIGPGLGALTERLLRVAPVTAIEIEPKFCEALTRKFEQLTIVNEDVRLVDFAELGEGLVVFGNLPYSFSTDIIFHLLSFPGVIKRAVLMLQREFGERVAAQPGGKSYGVLTISVQLTADVKLGPIIKGDSFHPPTEVDSIVLELSFPEKPKYQVQDPFWTKRVVSAAFQMRRKKLKNTLKGSQVVPGDAVDRGLSRSGISGDRRAETLSIAEFIALADALKLEAEAAAG